MSIIFNDWATAWGEPSYNLINDITERLKQTPVKYYVIDAGWYKKPNCLWNDSHGDWVPSERFFPRGLKAASELIIRNGLVPGIWFEAETCGANSKMFEKINYLLSYEGYPITSGKRRFLDFRKRDTWVYLNSELIKMLKDCRFGYLKLDYNASIGIGADGAESPGEALREHIICVQNYIKKIYSELPDIVIENCASGGMRLEPSMTCLTDVSSFSDSHECREIPLISAGLSRIMLPSKTLIWVVIRKNDSLKELTYTLASGFLGRICLSGDISQLDEEKFKIVVDALGFYMRVCDIIRDGETTVYGSSVSNYRKPCGWQAVFRINRNQNRALIVLHTFLKNYPECILLPLPKEQRWEIEGVLTDSSMDFRIEGDNISIKPENENSALVLELSGMC
jgi:alpha-galactosidase